MSLEVDTIVAVATAPGPGAVALVRLSGPGAHAVLRRLAPTMRERLPPVRRSQVTWLEQPHDGVALDQVVVVRYDAPDSFTGEDVVELSCHGGWLVPTLVLDACLEAGARLAEPGEFTRRAYLHGKVDLVQAEAVADLVSARSRAMQRAALGHLDRGLSERVTGLRRSLVHLEALLAHHLDFPEEDDAPVPLDRVGAEAADLVGRLDGLLDTAPEGELLREGAVVVLAGRPNVGKSSLYNALLGEDRAIVTEVPGTTRDALESLVQMGGYPFRLVDTAGLRDSDDRVERLGVEVARRHLGRADVVLLCVEAGAEPDEAELRFGEEVEGVPVVLVETKADLLEGGEGGPRPLEGGFAALVRERVRVSALTGEGMGTLRSLLPRLVYSGLVGLDAEAPVLTRERQIRALRRSRDEVEAFRAALEDGVPAEVAATHLRSAETGLEELVGVVSVDDVLDAVFREFCIGK